MWRVSRWGRSWISCRASSLFDLFFCPSAVSHILMLHVCKNTSLTGLTVTCGCIVTSHSLPCAFELQTCFFLRLYCVCSLRGSGEQRSNIFPLRRGAAVLLSPARSRAGHCICVLCITSCVRLWIVGGTMVRFALKGHLSHFTVAAGCKGRHIQQCTSETMWIFLFVSVSVSVMNHNLDMSIPLFCSWHSLSSPSGDGAPRF